MSELVPKNYAVIPYAPRSNRKWRRWGLAGGMMVMTAVAACLPLTPIPSPRELPRADATALTPVPNERDAQIRLAGEEQPTLAEDEPLPTAAPQLAPTEDEQDFAPFELIPIPTGTSRPQRPSFGDLGQGPQEKIKSELTTAVSMAERNALYAARSRLIACLRMVARLRDAQANVDLHSTALAAAFLALDEADDFDDQGVQYQADVLTRNYIAGHQTTILKSAPTPSAVRARSAYYRFARQKLIEAAGAQSISAELLYVLGRVEGELTKKMRESHQRRAPRELPLFEAAVAVNPGHYIAANELGVALARTGDYRRSAIAFEHSARIRSTPEVLANLEYVSRHLGDHQTAAQVRQQLAGQPTMSAMMPVVSVVSLEAFNRIPASGAENPASLAAHGQPSGRPGAAVGASSGAYPCAPQPQTLRPVRDVRAGGELFW